MAKGEMTAFRGCLGWKDAPRTNADHSKSNHRWELISRAVGTRSYHQCRQRYLLLRRKEAKRQGVSLANHPRLDGDRVGPHYEEPQFEHYYEGEEDEDGESAASYGDDGDETVRYRQQSGSARGGPPARSGAEEEEDEEEDELDLELEPTSATGRTSVDFGRSPSMGYNARHRTDSLSTALMASNGHH